MLRTEAIKQFLDKAVSPLAKMYNPSMEVQVNVAQDDGERYVGEYKGKSWRGWQKGDDIWKNIRIPLNADTQPTYHDTEMRFNLDKHAEGIGMTGWDWKNKRSLWFGYDFDSIANHSGGISQDKLDELVEACSNVDWITIYKSTSGLGFHIYVFVEGGIETKTHTEHAAVARALVGLLSATTGYDFSTNVDCVGGIMWVWHRKQEGTDGLTLIKEGRPILPTKIPKNWRDHINVVNRRQKRVSAGTAKQVASAVESMELEQEHTRVLQWFTHKSKQDWWYDTDNNMLVCHTLDLKECHTQLKLRGFFETVAKNGGEQNAFAFPNRGGSWTVRRFGSETTEDKSWATDEKGWTKTLFNEEPRFAKTMAYFGALENEKGEYIFSSFLTGKKALMALHINLGDTNVVLNERRMRIKFIKKEGKLVIQTERNDVDPTCVGWVVSDTNKRWIKVVRYSEEGNAYDLDIDLDSIVRHTVHNQAEDGWYIKINDEWTSHKSGSVDDVLKHILPDSTMNEIKQLKGKATVNSWHIENTPFEEEYPGLRVWNMYSSQFAMSPRRGIHPTWDNMLNHIGKTLNEAIGENAWCRNNDIVTGADYLFVWIASMFKEPARSLPYLFLFGQQNTGKTSLHEALKVLMKKGRGYMRGDSALSNNTGFNEELLNVVLAVIEETDLSHNSRAYNRLKDLVTATDLFVNRKGKSPFMSKNYTHWMQTSNDATAIPLFDGDTRVTVLEVLPLDNEIPKHRFEALLLREAPAFLFDVLNYELPEPEGRLGLPVIDTRLKLDIQASNYNALEMFIREQCVVVKGHRMLFGDFVGSFLAFHNFSGQSNSKENWNKKLISMKFPKWAPIIKANDSTSNKVYIGNLVLKGDYDLAKQKGEPFVEDGSYYVINEMGKMKLKQGEVL